MQARVRGRWKQPWIGAAALGAALVALRPCRAAETTTSAQPAETTTPDHQVELLSKLSLHDRGFAARAGSMVHIVILVRQGLARSGLWAASLMGALSRQERFGGLPHVQKVVPYENAQELATRCRDEHLALVYVTPGLEGEVERIRTGLTGVDVMTVAATPELVAPGIVLGFEVNAGRTKMLVNYEQALQQKVDFDSRVLRLMKRMSQ